MSIIAPPAKIKGLFEALFKQKDILKVTAGIVLADPIILAEWQMIRGAGTELLQLKIPEYAFSGLIRRTAGAGSVQYGFYESADGITWIPIDNLTSTSATFQWINRGITNDRILDTSNFFAFIAFNSNGTTTGEIKNVGLLAHVFPNPGMTIKRIK